MGFEVKHKRSVRKRTNSFGEITEACGSPQVTGYKLDLNSFNYSDYIENQIAIE